MCNPSLLVKLADLLLLVRQKVTNMFSSVTKLSVSKTQDNNCKYYRVL